MAETKIEWADYTFNPWIGCSKVSPGCTHCYAERDQAQRRGRVEWGPHGTRSKTSAANWRKPLAWNRQAEAEGVRRRVFCASLADVFEDWTGVIRDHCGIPLLRCDHCGKLSPEDEAVICDCAGLRLEMRPLTMADLRADLFDLIQATPQLDWLLLTKRPQNIRRMWVPIPAGGLNEDEVPFRCNVGLGTSVEDQPRAIERVPKLLECAELVRFTFVSAEPLLGAIDLVPALWRDEENFDPEFHRGIDWVIAGGESGPGARPMHPDWVRSLRDQCQAAGVPLLFKQWGEWIPYEQVQPPMWESQHGFFIDGHHLPDGLVDHEPVDGWWWPADARHIDQIYQRVPKKLAGRRLDGREWLEFPEEAHA